MVGMATWGSLTSHYQSVHFPMTWLWASRFAHLNVSFHTRFHIHNNWHLWLQWLPVAEMKSYFCFQITDCQSNKWICSHQRCKIDILFSNFNLFFLWGLLSCGAATHAIVFLDIVSNQAARRCCSLSGGAYSSAVVAAAVESYSDQHLLVFTKRASIETSCWMWFKTGLCVQQLSSGALLWKALRFFFCRLGFTFTLTAS